MDKKLIWLGATIGSLAGAYLPALWGDSDIFSPVSFLLGAVGAIIGIIVMARLAREYS